MITAGLALCLSACRVVIPVPEGGRVVSQSGAYLCRATSTCSIDVVDAHFNETFEAIPNGNNSFLGWAEGDGALCASRQAPCVLSTRGFDGDENLVAILESDQAFYLTPVFLKNTRLSRNDLDIEGSETGTADGFNVQGSLGLRPDSSPDEMFSDVDMDFRLDAEGELLSMVGDATLPRQITDHVGVLGSSRAQLGLYTGAEINARGDVGLRLIDERQYLLFFLSSGVELEIGDRAGGSDVVSISTPLGGSVVMISDPTDQMLYRYGSMLGETRGEAESDQGLLRFVPLAGTGGAVAFHGHRYETGDKSVGIKVFDLLNFSGEYVIREPSFADIDLEDPFNSPVGYFAGVNGRAAFAFSVLGFGLFEFDLAEASANISFQPLEPAKQQRMSIFGKVAPDVSWQPEWFPILPAAELRLVLNVDAAGKLVLKLSGAYESFLPAANLTGKVVIRNEDVAMQARVDLPALDMPLEINFRDGNTYASVDLKAGIGDYLRRPATEVFDDVDSQLDQALADLDSAASDYQFELSLRGLREVIPTITASAISRLQAIPPAVYSSVYAEVRSEINDRRYCALGICTPSNSKRDSIARSAASSARSKAQTEIAPYVDAMQALRDRAAEEDDDSVREALRLALIEAYEHRQIDRTISVSVSVNILIKTITVSESHRINRQVLDAEDAQAILAAAGNIDQIPATSERLVSAQAVVDQLPLREALESARAEVAAGLSQLPGIAAVGYEVIDGEYSGILEFSNGSRYAVELNVLDPDTLLAGLNRLAVDYVIEH